jgi:sigma-B regulation protein RsbU (phosphoserine phosphatase)
MTREEGLPAGYEALLDEDSERHYEYAPCGYLSTTPDGLILRANSTFLTLTGYTRPELLGRYTFAELLTGGGRIYHETHYAPMLRMQGSAREIALDIVCADGSRLPVLVNAVLERDAEGNPLVVRAAVFDARDRREYERELLRAKDRAQDSEARARALARTLQQTLIPPTPPDVPGLDVAAVYRPSGDGEEVGGDFYDVFQVADDDWVVAIGDVCGKGVDAAVLTALVRYALRGAAVRQDCPSDMLTDVNDVLLRDQSDRFCTVGVLRLRRSDEGWLAIVASAGHPAPLLRRSGQPVGEVASVGPLLGVLEDAAYDDVELPLQPEDVLLLYTDGVPEGRSGQGFYGEQRMQDVLGRDLKSADDVTTALLADVLAFQQGVSRDDIAMVAVRVPPG